MKATIENIKQAIKQANVLDDDTATLDNTIDLAEQGIDSLDIVNVYLILEEKFDIKIPDEDLDKVKTVESIIAYINNKLSG